MLFIRCRIHLCSSYSILQSHFYLSLFTLEFIAAAAERRTFLKRKDVVRSAFIIFDLVSCSVISQISLFFFTFFHDDFQNSDGKISSSDICSLLGIEAEGIETEVNARELIQEFDLDGNGEVS